MILNCLSTLELGLPQRHFRTNGISPFGNALVFVSTTELKSLDIHLSRDVMESGLLSAEHPRYGHIVPVWVRIVEKCEDGSYLGFQTDLRSRPFGIKAYADQIVKFYAKKTLIAA